MTGGIDRRPRKTERRRLTPSERQERERAKQARVKSQRYQDQRQALKVSLLALAARMGQTITIDRQAEINRQAAEVMGPVLWAGVEPWLRAHRPTPSRLREIALSPDSLDEVIQEIRNTHTKKEHQA